MRILTSFPARLRAINRYVADVRFYSAFSRDDYNPEELAHIDRLKAEGIDIDAEPRGYYEYFVTLKDGRCFAFGAYTPELLRTYMTRKQELSFINSGLVVVSEISEEALLEALEHCFHEAHSYGIRLDHFGILCSRSDLEGPERPTIDSLRR